MRSLSTSFVAFLFLTGTVFIAGTLGAEETELGGRSHNQGLKGIKPMTDDLFGI
jgi:hypothetical protein